MLDLPETITTCLFDLGGVLAAEVEDLEELLNGR